MFEFDAAISKFRETNLSWNLNMTHFFIYDRIVETPHLLYRNASQSHYKAIGGW